MPSFGEDTDMTGSARMVGTRTANE